MVGCDEVAIEARTLGTSVAVVLDCHGSNDDCKDWSVGWIL